MDTSKTTQKSKLEELAKAVENLRSSNEATLAFPNFKGAKKAAAFGVHWWQWEVARMRDSVSGIRKNEFNPTQFSDFELENLVFDFSVEHPRMKVEGIIANFTGAEKARRDAITKKAEAEKAKAELAVAEVPTK